MKAADDAVSAGQAEWAEGDQDRLEWKVEGEIEVSEGESAPRLPGAQD